MGRPRRIARRLHRGDPARRCPASPCGPRGGGAPTAIWRAASTRCRSGPRRRSPGGARAGGGETCAPDRRAAGATRRAGLGRRAGRGRSTTSGRPTSASSGGSIPGACGASLSPGPTRRATGGRRRARGPGGPATDATRLSPAAWHGRGSMPASPLKTPEEEDLLLHLVLSHHWPRAARWCRRSTTTPRPGSRRSWRARR